jgi:site-specific recombinase XerD
MESLIAQVNQILNKYASTRVNGRVASERSITAAGESLRASFRQLIKLGYKLEKPTNLSQKHIEALCKLWLQSGRAPKTIQGNLSHLRIFARWIGKGNLVKSVFDYLPEVPKSELRVKTVAARSKSWAENGIDVRQKVREADAIDWRFGLMLRMHVAFGLRRMEVLQAIPWKNDMGDKFAAYRTKGGRPRDIYIDNDAQRKVLDIVKAHLKKTEPLGWTTRSDGSAADLAYSIRRYSRLLPQIGITRKEAMVTGHGLRAQFAENAALIASLIPPTLGGTGGQMEKDELNLQRAKVSELLGHSRISITPAYYGTFGRDQVPDSPDRTKEAIAKAVPFIPAERLKDIPPSRMGDCARLTAELLALRAYVEPRVTQALWEYHSSRHNADWLTPAAQNVAALEAAALHFVRAAD